MTQNSTIAMQLLYLKYYFTAFWQLTDKILNQDTKEKSF